MRVCHEVTHRPDGESGLAAISETGFDICLLDINIPSQDGFPSRKDPAAKMM